MLGIIILIIGLAFLLQNLGLITGSVWGIFWPILLIIIGLALISRRKHCWCCGGHHRHHDHDWHKFGDEMKERFGGHHEHWDEEKKKEEQKEE